ncbi:hypothetical protein B0T25DRAFT_61935 [Lasiosphaeria hispida]|uniref:Uncharacterized protein n=1 Tax=Lasiosphaeria hispida TaxID=260671 RepID=A0AAJ0HX94_9PEZI|nr:hypothetical protein B0T25DRAFT_61935 [Lasiosphaeria hispida]
MAQRATATVTAITMLNSLGLGQSQDGWGLFAIESAGPPTRSTSILTARTRLKLRSKLTAKTALGAIYAEVGTTVRRSRIRKNDDNTYPPTRKRRKMPPPTRSTLLRTATRRQIRSDGGVSRSRQARVSSPGRKRSGRRCIRAPPSSQHSSSKEGTTHIPEAKFEEWPLQDAVLKRATVNGLATFQLQFTWGNCTDDVHKDRATSQVMGDSGSSSPAEGPNSAKQGPRRRATFTAGEKAPSQTDDDVQLPALTEGETEWKIEKIVATRK